MRKRRLRIRALTNLDPMGLSVAIAGGNTSGELPARHKWTWEERPYGVANEYICGELAHFLGLPIPPFAIAESEQLKRAIVFSTIDINFDGRDFSPVEPEFCVKQLESLCAGILVFDVLIANSDRHDGNVVVNHDEQPTEIYLYDHDVALFGYFANEGKERLRDMRGRLGITGKTPTGGNRHVFIDHFTSNRFFGEWCDRLSTIPSTFIERICGAATKYGITQSEGESAACFLKERRDNIRGILNRHGREFAGIPKWGTV